MYACKCSSHLPISGVCVTHAINSYTVGAVAARGLSRPGAGQCISAPSLSTSIVKSQNKAAARGVWGKLPTEPQKLTHFLESIAFLATNLLCGNDCGKPVNIILKIIIILLF